MKTGKRAKLEASGWSVGSAQDFLQLSDPESALVELRLALSHSLRNWRKRRGLSQVELARRLKSSQSRIAKMEAGDTSVSVDLLVRSLFAIGAKPKDLAKTINQLDKRVAG